MVKAYGLYKNIDLNLTQDNVLTELKKQYDAFTEWKKQSLRVALFVYPFAAAGGFMLGGTIGSGKTIEVFMSNYWVLIALVISILVLVPLSYLLAKWMTKVAFGKFIDQLKERIDELETEG
jgi:ABC-type nitrate/sulfonate/bicarbonate transport system permease component